jgi:hypothetical protein
MYLTILSFLGVLLKNPVSAQYDQMSTPELKSSATGDFKSARYTAALEKFTVLISRYPRDGFLQYYSGICMYKTNKTLSLAIQYLSYAAGKPDIPSDVWYHLGEAYMRNYQFSDARKAYLQYNEVAGRNEAREKVPLRKVRMAEDAIEISREYNTVEIIASSLFSFSDSVFVRRIKAAGGSLDFRPDLSGTERGEENDYLGLCFVPKNLAKGEYVYLAAYGKSGKNGSDIFRIKMTGGNKHGEPELIEDVSSEYNEILPYYDPVGEDLYFASEGYSGMGGFDVFKSHYKKEDGTWSEPLNLGFPVNSPMNEYLFIPGANLGEVILITDRQGLDTMLTAYLMRIKEPRQTTLSNDQEKLRKIGMLGGIESIPVIVDISDDGFRSGDTVVRVKRGTRSPAVPGDLRYSDEYSRLVREALGYQYKSDSLARISREARQKVNSVPDPDQRWSLQSSMMLWEKQSADFQVKANECYAQLKEMENEYSQNQKVPVAVKQDTVINAITTYRFNNPPPSTGPDKAGNATATVLVASKDNTGLAGPKETIPSAAGQGKQNEFLLIGKSPYSSSSPIPMDIRIPPGAFYRIQLGVYSKKQDDNNFGGMSPLSAETVPGKSLYRYYAGRFVELESARSALNIARSRGYKDAFIVAWYDGRKLPPDKVAELEKRDKR